LTGRLRAVGWTLVFLGGGYVLSVLLILVFALLARPALTGGAVSLVALQTMVLLAVFAAMTWLIGRRALQLSPADFGLVPLRQGIRGFGHGFLLGTTLAAAAMAAAVAIGKAEWRNDGGTLSGWLGAVGVTGVLLLPAAFVEELIFRGVPLVALSKAFGRGLAVVGLSILFAVAHLQNDGVSPLALANIALAGVFLSLAFFTPGGLGTATGAHFGWNLALAALAAPVSGLLLPIPWLDYLSRGPAWLTGGGFGPEGGLLASLCLAAGALVAGRRMTRRSFA
jgi:membrane protease YdiL (CAAX protease family)